MTEAKFIMISPDLEIESNEEDEISSGKNKVQHLYFFFLNQLRKCKGEANGFDTVCEKFPKTFGGRCGHDQLTTS